MIVKKSMVTEVVFCSKFIVFPPAASLDWPSVWPNNKGSTMETLMVSEEYCHTRVRGFLSRAGE